MGCSGSKPAGGAAAAPAAEPATPSAPAVGDVAWVDELLEKFSYIDEDHNGKLSLAELQEVHKLFDDPYDDAAVVAEFAKLDVDGDGEVTIREYLLSFGVAEDALPTDDELEARRAAQLEAQAAALANGGIAAVEVGADVGGVDAADGADAPPGGVVAADAVDATPAAVAVESSEPNPW